MRPEVVSSAQNRNVAAARLLLTRKGRTAASAFLVEGPRAIRTALEVAPGRVRELFVTDEAADREVTLLRAVAAAEIPVRVVTAKVLATLGETVTPQGVVGVVAMPSAGLEAIATSASILVAILDQASDPGNAGSIIRTADAAGADAVVLTRGSVDAYSGKCVRATAGSLFHLPIVTGPTLEMVVTTARSAGLAILATTAAGTDDLDELADAGTLSAPTAWIFGNEAHGLAEGALAMADRTVRVPLHGRAESLNLAATAAVCLYASARAQRPHAGGAA